MTADGSSALVARFADALAEWKPDRIEQIRLAREYSAFLAQDPAAAVHRDRSPRHLTASAFVFSPDFEQVLLCFHRKGNFWVQLGGHIEPMDATVQAAALREAREEGGIEALAPVSAAPVDLDRHDLGDGFVRCDTHWDVGFAFTASASAEPVASAESAAVRWWPVAAPPEGVPPRFAERLRHAAEAASRAAADRG